MREQPRFTLFAVAIACVAQLTAHRYAMPVIFDEPSFPLNEMDVL